MQGPELHHSPGPIYGLLWLSCFFWGTKRLQTDSRASSMHICKHTVPTAHCWSFSSLCQCHQPRDTLPVPQAQRAPQLGDVGGRGAALTIAEEARGARALQDIVLAERPIKTLPQVLGVALALPAQALAPARAWLHIPGADTGFVVGGRCWGAVARVPSPGGEEMVLREVGVVRRTAGSWPGTAHGWDAQCTSVCHCGSPDPAGTLGGIWSWTKSLPAWVADALSTSKVPVEAALG